MLNDKGLPFEVGLAFWARVKGYQFGLGLSVLFWVRVKGYHLE